MKSVFLISLFLFCTGQALKCQVKKDQDSLLKVTQTAKDPKEKMKAYTDLARGACSYDYNEALDYINKAFVLAQQYRNEQGLADAYGIRAVIHLNLGENDKILSELDSAIYYNKRTNNKKSLASNYGNMSAYYLMIEDGKSGMEYCLKTLKMYQELGDKRGEAITLGNLSGIQWRWFHDLNQAEDGFKKTCAIFHELKDYYNESMNVCNLAFVFADEKKYDESVFNYKKAIKTFDSLKSIEGLGAAYFGLGQVYTAQEEYNKALPLLFKAENFFGQINKTFKRADALAEIAGAYYNLGNSQEAIKYYEQYRQIAEEMNIPVYRVKAMKGLSNAYAKAKDYENAYHFSVLSTDLSDSLFNEERLEGENKLNVQYNVYKKEQENRDLLQQNKITALELSKRNYLLIVALLGLVFLSAVSVLFIRQNRLSSKHKMVVLEQKLLRSQMNPHFIFNSLNSISRFIYENEPREAGKYLSDFSKLMRITLESSVEEFIPLETEMQTVSSYVNLLQLNYGDSFSYQVAIADDTDISQVRVPSMLLQPFVENAIKHGLSGMENGVLSVSIAKENNSLLVQITDNGKGMLKGSEKDGHKSMTMKITRERQAVMAKNGYHFTFEVLTNEPSGTKIIFKLPLA
jgi:tetratricopeptide (TPR) repeat protein